MEQPLERLTKWPAFPTSIEDNRYTVVLPWKGDEHETDNRQQAPATAGAMLRKLGKKADDWKAFDKVLLEEYPGRGAVKVNPDPESGDATCHIVP